MSVLIACLAIAIPVTVVQKVQLALQLGYMASLWQLASSVASLIALFTAVSQHASLAWLVAASIGTPSVVFAVSGLVFWIYQRPECRPALALATTTHAAELARSGSLFFVIQVAGVIAVASDTLIIAQVLGPQSVAQYSVASRLVEGMVMVSALFLTPLWPAYADAYARGDQRWIRRTLVASLGATVIATALMAVALIIASKFVTAAWVGSRIPYSLALFVACSAWAVIKATGNALAMFLNGVGWIAFQALVAVLFAVLAVLTKIAFAQEMGLIGIPIALALSYTVTVAIPYAWRMPQLFAKVSS
jgi:O-antigen/teichoic acid export membrane protein